MLAESAHKINEHNGQRTIARWTAKGSFPKSNGATGCQCSSGASKQRNGRVAPSRCPRRPKKLRRVSPPPEHEDSKPSGVQCAKCVLSYTNNPYNQHSVFYPWQSHKSNIPVVKKSQIPSRFDPVTLEQGDNNPSAVLFVRACLVTCLSSLGLFFNRL